MRKLKINAADLALFEGDGEGAAAGENGSQAAAGNSGEVVYGVQEKNEVAKESAAGSEGNTVDLDAEFNELIKGKYKDQYTKATQSIIDKRFAKAKQAEKAAAETQPLLDLLSTRYKVTSGSVAEIMDAINDDDDYWQMVGDQRGMTASQAKQFATLEAREMSRQRAAAEAENTRRAEEQMRIWSEDAEKIKQTFPNFDLEKELELHTGRQFLDMLSKGVPMEHAFKVIHFDDIVTDAMKATAKQQEKRVTENVRARGTRPAENGASSQSAFTVKDDVHKLTKKDRAEIAMKVQRGEIIRF